MTDEPAQDGQRNDDDTSVTAATSPGQRFQLDPNDVEAITNMAKDIAWPANARRVIDGRGECLGATYDANGARLGRNTSKREAFCMKLTAALAREPR